MYKFEVFETAFDTVICIADKESFMFPSGYTLEEYEQMLKVLIKTRFNIKINNDDYLVYREYGTNKAIYTRKNKETVRRNDIYDHLLFIYKELEKGKKEIELINV